MDSSLKVCVEVMRGLGESKHEWSCKIDCIVVKRDGFHVVSVREQLDFGVFANQCDVSPSRFAKISCINHLANVLIGTSDFGSKFAFFGYLE